MDEIKNSEYSEFLESAIRYIYEHKPDSVTIVVEGADGDPGLTMTSYYQSGARNKLNAIMNVLTDYILEIIGNNRDYVREILMGEESEEDG